MLARGSGCERVVCAEHDRAVAKVKRTAAESEEYLRSRGGGAPLVLALGFLSATASALSPLVMVPSPSNLFIDLVDTLHALPWSSARWETAWQLYSSVIVGNCALDVFFLQTHQWLVAVGKDALASCAGMLAMAIRFDEGACQVEQGGAAAARGDGAAAEGGMARAGRRSGRAGLGEVRQVRHAARAAASRHLRAIPAGMCVHG